MAHDIHTYIHTYIHIYIYIYIYIGVKIQVHKCGHSNSGWWPRTTSHGSASPVPTYTTLAQASSPNVSMRGREGPKDQEWLLGTLSTDRRSARRSEATGKEGHRKRPLLNQLTQLDELSELYGVFAGLFRYQLNTWFLFPTPCKGRERSSPKDASEEEKEEEEEEEEARKICIETSAGSDSIMAR